MDWKFGETKDVDEMFFCYGEPDEGGYPTIWKQGFYTDAKIESGHQQDEALECIRDKRYRV